jgi:hypothetical protein
MAEFPDLLINPNPNAPTLDASGNQVRGINIFETTAERDALNITVRIPGALAVIKGSDELYQYTASTVDDTAWQDASNWLGIGSAGGSGVQNLNNLDGNITLVGGGGITISDDGSSTITVTGGGGGVTDIDGETGSITLTAGEGIELDVVTGTGEIQISSTGGSTEGIDLSFIVRDTAYTSDYDHEGTVFNFGLTGALTFGVYRYDGTTWSAASNAAPSSAKGLLAIGLGQGSFVLEKGIFALTVAAPFTAGDVLYLGVSGGIINDISGLTSGEVVRVIGTYLGQDGSVYKSYFNPSPDWIEIA